MTESEYARFRAAMERATQSFIRDMSGRETPSVVLASTLACSFFILRSELHRNDQMNGTYIDPGALPDIKDLTERLRVFVKEFFGLTLDTGRNPNPNAPDVLFLDVPFTKH